MKVLITGANRGIGLALTQQYIAQEHEVYAVCRKASEALNATGATVIEGVDVSNATALRALSDRLYGVTLDIVINNAGILESEQLCSIDYDAVLAQFLVNAMAPLRLTESLIGQLSKGSKVAMITSRMGSISDNGSGGYYGYRMSKAALNAAGVSLAKDLAARGVAVALLHPGFVQTEMVGYAGDISAETAAAGLRERIEELTLENSGGFWHANGEVLPW